MTIEVASGRSDIGHSGARHRPSLNTQHFISVFFTRSCWCERSGGDIVVEQICASKRVVNGLRDGPLGAHIDRLAEVLAQGHDPRNAGRILLCAGRFARFAEGRGGKQGDWDDAVLVDFLVEGEAATADAFYAVAARTVLCEIGAFAGTVTQPAETIRLLADFDGYLRDARGLSEAVRRAQAETLRQVLAFHRSRHSELPLGAFTGKDALDLFQQVSERYQSVNTRQKFAGDLRQVLRFLHLRGLVDTDLASTVPLFINYRLSTVPDFLPWDAVKRLVASVDPSVAPGKRDRAILLLIATVALRPRTVRDLTLDQVHWREAEIRIPRTKSRRGINVPLSQEVGQALSAYVLEERPKTDLRTVFLRHTPPHGPFASGSAITSMINSRLDRAGIAKARGAANLLRHSLATQLVNAGVPIKQVSDLFGHASIDTTAVYTKVDLRSLSKVPLPFALGRSA
jgi:site-specific recombinase XerD